MSLLVLLLFGFSSPFGKNKQRETVLTQYYWKIIALFGHVFRNWRMHAPHSIGVMYRLFGIIANKAPAGWQGLEFIDFTFPSTINIHEHWAVSNEHTLQYPLRANWVCSTNYAGFPIEFVLNGISRIQKVTCQNRGNKQTGTDNKKAGEELNENACCPMEIKKIWCTTYMCKCMCVNGQN